MAAPWLKTLWDAYEAAATPEERAAWVEAFVRPKHRLTATLRADVGVKAPCCGRPVAADDVLDLRLVPDTLVRGRDLDWACDGCWTRMIRDPANGWTRSRFVRALGAPAATIKEMKAREEAEERIQQVPRGKKFNREQVREQVRLELPNGVREIPGTEHPTRGGT